MKPIRCPKCGTEITLDAAISEQMSAEFEQKVTERLVLERGRIEAEARQKATDAAGLELADLKNQVAEKAGALALAQKKELELRQQQRALEDAKKSLEVNVARKMDEERQKVRDEALKKADEEHRLKDMEKDRIISDMKSQLAEAQRRAEQGSQQAQGEVQELDLEAQLKAAFPLDRIEPVPKGKKGADVIQRVCDRAGRVCGTIVWEAKRTKNWDAKWPGKLKEDQREAKADLAIVLTTAMPKEVETFGKHEGVWVTNSACALSLGSALRDSLVGVAAARASSLGKQDKMELLYDYLSGPEFRRRVEAIADTFVAMKKELDREKAAMSRNWAAREKHIECVLLNTGAMYGEIETISGAELQRIEHLELKAIADSTSEEHADVGETRLQLSLPEGSAGRAEPKAAEPGSDRSKEEQ